MLTPEYLLHVSEGAEEIASELHTRIMQKMVKRILLRKDRGDSYILTAVDKWQIQTLQDAGYLLEDIQKELATYTGYEAKEIARAFEDAGVTALSYDDKVYEKAGIPAPPPLKQSPATIRLMQATYEKTMGTWENLTGTTANSCHAEFIKAMDEIYAAINSGEVGYIEAYEKAIDKLCLDGLTITYPTGHKDTLETAALRCVRTGVAQATAEAQLARMRENGDDLVLVSSHMGARPSHQEWQGQVYSMGEDDRYPNFYEYTHYGEGNGLCGWNCRHHFSPWFEGMSNPYADYSNEENLKLYEDTQEQRAMERGIRKTKRSIAGYEEAINTLDPNDPIAISAQQKLEKLRAKLKEQKREYKEFCREKGFRELPERMRIAKPGVEEYDGPQILEVKPARNVIPEQPTGGTEKPVKMRVSKKPGESLSEAEEPPQGVTEPPAGPYKWKPKKKAFGKFGYMFGMDGTDVVNIAELVNKSGNESLAKTVSVWADTFWYRYDEKSLSHYDELGVVRWKKGDKYFNANPYAVLAHEMGHACDHAMDSIGNETFEERDKVEKILKDLGIAKEVDLRSRRPSNSDEFIRAITEDMENIRTGKVEISPKDGLKIENVTNCTGFSDFLDGIFGTFDSLDKGYITLGFAVLAGHGEAYYDGISRKIQKQGKLNEFAIAMGAHSRNEAQRTLRTFVVAEELWGNLQMATTLRGDTTHPDASFDLELFERYCPNAVKAFRSIMDDHAKALDEYLDKGVSPEKIPKAIEKGKKSKRTDSQKAEDVREGFEIAEPEPPHMPPVWKPGKKVLGKYGYMPGMNGTHMRNFVDRVNSTGDDSLTEVISAWADTFRYKYDKNDQSYDDKGLIRWGLNDKELSDSPYASLAHEMGHACDHRMDSLGHETFESLGKIEEIMEKLGISRKNIHLGRRPSACDEFMGAVRQDIRDFKEKKTVISQEDGRKIEDVMNATGICDFLDGAFGASGRQDKGSFFLGCKVNAGHGDEYYDRTFSLIKKSGKADEFVRAMIEEGGYDKTIYLVNMHSDEGKVRETLRTFETASELWANIQMASTVKGEGDAGLDMELLERYCPHAVKAFRNLMQDHAEVLRGYQKEGISPDKIPGAVQKEKEKPSSATEKLFNTAKEAREMVLIKALRQPRDRSGREMAKRAKFEPDTTFAPNRSESFNKMVTDEYADIINLCRSQDMIRLHNLWCDQFDYEFALHDDPDKRGVFTPGKNTISWYMPGGHSFDALAHELGHGFDKKIGQKMQNGTKYRDALRKALNKRVYTIGDTASASDAFIMAMRDDIGMIKAGLTAIEPEDRRELDDGSSLAKGFADFLDGAFGARTQGTENIPKVLYGHGEKYYSRNYNDLKEAGYSDEQLLELCRKQGAQIDSIEDLKDLLRNYETASELWANITSALAMKCFGNGEIDYFEKYCPQALAVYKDIVKKHLRYMEKKEGRDGRQT